MTDAFRWKKARRSGNEGACIELAYVGFVRDSKNPTGPTLAVDVGGLLAALKADRVDR